MELRPFIYYTATFISLCAGLFGFFFMLVSFRKVVDGGDDSWWPVFIGVALTVQAIMFMSATTTGQIGIKR